MAVIISTAIVERSIIHCEAQFKCGKRVTRSAFNRIHNSRSQALLLVVVDSGGARCLLVRLLQSFVNM